MVIHRDIILITSMRIQIPFHRSNIEIAKPEMELLNNLKIHTAQVADHHLQTGNFQRT